MRFRKLVIRNFVSPYGLAMISYAFFLFACLVPPSVYSHFMMEPDLMFLDPATMLFYTLCVGSFLAGAWLVSWLYPATFVVRKFRTRISPTRFLLAPLTLAVAAATLTSLYLITEYPIIMLSLLTQQGEEAKEIIAFEVNGHFAFVPLILMGITWWALWRYSELDFKGWRRRLVSFFLFLAVASVIVLSIITMGRNTLMLGLGGPAILYVFSRTVRKQADFKFIFRSGIVAAIFISLLFFVFSFMRGTDSWDGQVNQLIGYTAASYNRLAAVVNGDLRYPFAGHGLYLSSVVTRSRFLLGDVLNAPDVRDAWASEFGAVSRVGLDGRLIWSGAFGYIFAELGWFSFPFVFGYGMLYGVGWNWIKRGKVLGIVLYPCFGFCALFWVGSNYLLEAPTEILSIVAIILTGYELVFVRAASASSLLHQRIVEDADSTIVLHPRPYTPATRKLESQ